MATPGEKLAESLEVLHLLQVKSDIVAIKSSEISRTHRERLIRNGFLQEVSKGWYLLTNPQEEPGNSTAWYTSYWKFCSQYLGQKYGQQYCISADQSISIHAGNNRVPFQLVVRAPKAPNVIISLLHKTSLFVMRSPLPLAAEVIVKNGIRMLSLPSALIHCSKAMYDHDPIEMRTALAVISDTSDILRQLLDGGHSVIAGRLAGAFRNNGQEQIADEILQTMKSSGYSIRELNPFTSKPPVVLYQNERSPYVNRITLMWNDMRKVVLQHFPVSPGIPDNHEQYLKSVDEIYVMDAYHSLSIEKYLVTPELIEKVRIGRWNPSNNETDRHQRDAMAARGYWQASQAVKESIQSILNGENPGVIARKDHSHWFRELFSPSVTSGIIKASDLAGYRINQVYISQSMHVPLNKDAVRDAMPVLFDLLQKEISPGVRAVLGHFIFVYIHPFMDGNGRIARFLMNVMLASGGYPWTVIPVEMRNTYMNSLEKASVDGDIRPFADFMAHLVHESLKGTPLAKLNT